MAITPLMPVYPRCGVRPVRGEHCHLIDEDGTRYLDFASGIAVNLLGHSHAGLIGAIQQQAATLMHVSNLYGSPQGERLAQMLVDNLNAPEGEDLHATLSERELQTLQKIASGKKLSEIAEELMLSPKTVSVYRARVLDKLRLSNNAELTVYAIRNNLV